MSNVNQRVSHIPVAVPVSEEEGDAVYELVALCGEKLAILMLARRGTPGCEECVKIMKNLPISNFGDPGQPTHIAAGEPKGPFPDGQVTLCGKDASRPGVDVAKSDDATCGDCRVEAAS